MPLFTLHSHSGTDCGKFMLWLRRSKIKITVKLWEVINQVRIHDLLLQQVLLVEEEDDRGVLEPGICDDGPEQSFTLLHTILTRDREDIERETTPENKHKVRI